MSLFSFLSSFCVCLLVWLVIALPLLASPPPLPPEKENWVKKSETFEKNAKTLSTKKKKIEKKIKNLKENLSDKALSLQQEEQSLKEIKERLKTSQKSLEAHTKHLDNKRGEIASLIVSLVKMNSIPLDSLMLLSPDKSEDLMISYHAVRGLHPELNRQISALEQDITLLEQKKRNLFQDKKDKEQKTEALNNKRKDIRKLIAKRQKEHTSTTHAYKAAQEKALYASKTAKNLDELIKTVQKKNKKNRARPPAPSKKAPPVFKTTKTKRLPVAGRILVPYGGQDNIGATSQGMTIQALSGAMIVAPKAGTVKYAGNFKKYGRIILLEHTKNYHSLIAGLDKIDTVVGQKVSEGAPIASMHTQANVKHSVYYELRLKGTPVNPLIHLGNL